MWKIYYTDTTVTGHTEEDWQAAPDTGVQVIVTPRDPDPETGEPYRSGRSYVSIENEKPVAVYGKQLWDGVDEYDPFGWGVKYGLEIDYNEYMLIWNRACGDN